MLRLLAAVLNMEVSVLVENTTKSKDLKAEHGLSLYIEACGKKILFDTGASGLFLENAKKMGIDIQEVDALVVSHGHNDHGGGLKTFIETNNTADIYIAKGAFKPRENAQGEARGLDKNLISNINMHHLFKECTKIFDNVYIFNLSKLNDKIPVDKYFSYDENNNRIKDDFKDEQYLVIIEKNHATLFCGCCHRGIDVALKFINQKLQEMGLMCIDVVVGGLHTKGLLEVEDPYFYKVLNLIKDSNITFYLGHCTGSNELQLIKETVKDRVKPLYCGFKF